MRFDSRSYRHSRLDRRDLFRGGLSAVFAISAAKLGLAVPQGQESRRPGATDRGAPAGSGPSSESAQPDQAWRLNYDAPKTQRWRIGLRLETGGVACRDCLATFPVPMPWPEQTVRLILSEIDPRVDRWTFRDLPGGARQFVLTMPQVPAGGSPETMLELEITRSRTLPPTQTDDLVIPTRPDAELKGSLGVSPFIDTGNSRLRAAAKELAGQDHANPWALVEATYDWVRDQIEYVEGEIKPASQALRDGSGDCEELTSVFVALCRINKIPARMVWIPDHCYPEFYLEDGNGSGTWFPCQAAGTRQFGCMDEYRPVLQKGDRFKVPEKNQAVRYVAEFFRCVPAGNRQPRPIFVRELIEA